MDNNKYTSLGKAISYIGLAAVFIVIEMFSFVSAIGAAWYLHPGDYALAILAPAVFNVALWVYVAEFLLLCGNNGQRGLALVGAIVSLLLTIALDWLYLDIASVSISTETRAALGAALMWGFKGATAFHIGMHVLLILASEFAKRTMAEQARTFKVLAVAAQKADAKMEAAENEAAEVIAEQDTARALAALGKARGVNLLGSAPARKVEPVVIAHEPVASFAHDAPAMPESEPGKV